MTLPRTGSALVGVGVVLRGTEPRVLKRPTLPSFSGGVIQSSEMPPPALSLALPLLLGRGKYSVLGRTGLPDTRQDSMGLSGRSDSLEGHA